MMKFGTDLKYKLQGGARVGRNKGNTGYRPKGIDRA